MHIQTCQAENLATLMRKIKDIYGPSAVLLSVRKIEPNPEAKTPFLIEGMVGYEPEFAGNFASPIPQVNEVEYNQDNHVTTEQYTRKKVCAKKCHPYDAKVIALVGTLGAGKTTTAAKIAGRLLKKTQKPVGVISTDVMRPGGSALLSAYADMLQLHNTMAMSALDLRDRVARWNCRGPLVIDTRGCSPRDSLAISRLGSLLDSTSMPIEKYLVLSATEHRAVARETLDSYSDLAFSGVILARVDQAAGIGDCLEEVRKSGSEVVLVGTGERVPEDLMEPTKTALLALENAR